MSYLGKEIKKLGFGLMRLPKKDGEIDIEESKKMVDLYMSKGFTYFDTAYVYDNGKSEEAAKEILVKRYPRESFQLATKLPVWDRNASVEEIKQRFYTSLERTGAGYFDYYLLHSLVGEKSFLYDEYGMWDFVRELKEKGLINHFGFSFHDNAEMLDKILTSHPDAEFVQLQINYADWENEQVESRKCYEVARKHNKPIIVMEPVRGGSLANIPPEAAKVLKDANPNASIASWAIRFAASIDGIITVLSGMSTMEQVEDNISYMENFVPLTAEEKELTFKAYEIMSKIPQVPCTSCCYCVEGCPKNIPINKIFNIINFYDKFNNISEAKHKYAHVTGKENSGKANDCIACRKCENVCPQKIDIVDQLKRVTKVLG